MQIQWIENTCFLIKTSTSKRLLLNADFFCNTKNLSPLETDLILLSNPYIKKNCFDKNKIFNSQGNYSYDTIAIEGFKSFCDNSNGLKRGENILYKIEIENLTLCYLGNLGHILDNSIIKNLQSIDILFIPIGGNYFLDGALAHKLTSKINPKFVIPMGFKKFSNPLSLEGPQKFLNKYKKIIKIDDFSLNTYDFVNSSNTPTILLLNEKSSNF